MKHETDLAVQRLFVIGIQKFAIVGDGSGRGFQQSDQHVQQLRFARCGWSDDCRRAAGFRGERHVFEHFLVAELEGNVAHARCRLAMRNEARRLSAAAGRDRTALSRM